MLAVGSHRGPFPLDASGTVTLRVLVDHSIVEAFADNGTVCATARAYPGSSDAAGVYLTNRGASGIQLARFQGYQMKTATPPSLAELEVHAATRGA